MALVSWLNDDDDQVYRGALLQKMHKLMEAMLEFQADEDDVKKMLTHPKAQDRLQSMVHALHAMPDSSTESWGGALWKSVVQKSEMLKAAAFEAMKGKCEQNMQECLLKAMPVQGGLPDGKIWDAELPMDASWEIVSEHAKETLMKQPSVQKLLESLEQVLLQLSTLSK